MLIYGVWDSTTLYLKNLETYRSTTYVRYWVQLLHTTKISYVCFHICTCYGPYADVETTFFAYYAKSDNIG